MTKGATTKMQEQLNQIEEKLIKLNNQTKKASKEWRYILLNLNLRNKTIDDLKDIFGVSQTAINKWKNGEPIARDKKIFLAKMFGVTLDEYYENKCADDLYNSLVYNLEQIINIQDYKNLTYYDLKKLYEAKNEISEYINFVLYGNGDEKLAENEFDYLCQKLKANYEDNNVRRALNYKNLIILKEQNNFNEFIYHTIDLTRIVLLSENIKGIYLLLNKEDLDNILMLYNKLSKEYATFDSDKLVLETLLSMGASINKNNKLEYKITFDFYKKQMEQKIMKIVDMEE